MSFYRYGKQGSLLSSPTILLIIANAFVFVVMLISGDFGDCNSLTCELLAQTNQSVFQGAYWQLFTSMFVHFGFVHIIFNMFALYYFGRLNETYFGARSYLAIYFGAGLLGSVMSLFLLPLNSLSGGASGAIFGLVGSYVALARRTGHMRVAFLYAIMMLVMSATGFGMAVNDFAHVFGFVGGLAMGLLLSRESPSLSPGYSVTYTYG